MTVGDIYYVLFRHKWKILVCACGGLLAAAGLYRFRPPPFQSEAKLYVRYVTTADKTLSGPGGSDTVTKSPDQRGETIMDSESQILTSLDLSTQVAKAVGPAKILAKLGGGNELERAAAVVNAGLTVDVPLHSVVIDIIFKHPDPTLVQPVLRELVDDYLKMHSDIHEAAGLTNDHLTQLTDQLRASLNQTEDELRKARSKAGVISLDDTQKAEAAEMARLRQEIFTAQAELAERTSVLKEFARQSGAPAAGAPDAPASPEPTSAQIDDYRTVLTRLDGLRKSEQDLLLQFTPENNRVKEVRAQIAAAEERRQKLETDVPRLKGTPVAVTAAAPASADTIDVRAESARIVALQAKIKELNAQLEQVKAEASNVDQMAGQIEELLRNKKIQDQDYNYYATNLAQSRIDQALGGTQVSNISQIQRPSPPAIDRKKSLKLIGMVAAGGLGLGLAWAFLIELYLDRSIRRPIDVERSLRLPLFLSIPDLRSRRYRRMIRNAVKTGPGLPEGEGARALALAAAPQGAGALLHPFYETLRDRLISYFESRNLTHKPKLIAVTGLGRDAGVTTVAAGLAGCLSETGEGNVLLVDMTLEQGSAQQFYKGKSVCGIDTLLDTRDTAQVQGNLYVVGEEPNSDKLSRVMPQRFSKLVPKLKASDFDYIIFDMPAVSQISITPRLAGFMDMVLMVVESEKTDRDLIQRATTLLAESKAHVGVVLNKAKTYIPARLHQENLGTL